jgi:hypothetical protein
LDDEKSHCPKMMQLNLRKALRSWLKSQRYSRLAGVFRARRPVGKPRGGVPGGHRKDSIAKGLTRPEKTGRFTVMLSPELKRAISARISVEGLGRSRWDGIGCGLPFMAGDERRGSSEEHRRIQVFHCFIL